MCREKKKTESVGVGMEKSAFVNCVPAKEEKKKKRVPRGPAE